MKNETVKNKQLFVVFAVLTIISALYRVYPYEARPEWLGAPQLALAVFAGAVVSRKGISFLVVLLSMLFSDVLIHLVHLVYPTMTPGFYGGQMVNYLLIGLLTMVGFGVKSDKWPSILGGLVAAPVLFFLISNFIVWAGGGGYHRPFTFSGLMQCYTDALPFLRNSLSGSLIFGAVFFGGYYAWRRFAMQSQLV